MVDWRKDIKLSDLRPRKDEDADFEIAMVVQGPAVPTAPRTDQTADEGDASALPGRLKAGPPATWTKTTATPDRFSGTTRCRFHRRLGLLTRQSPSD